MSVHGFLRRPGGTILSFDPAGSTGTTVTGINDAGEITGYYTLANGRTLGFVRRADGTITSFEAPGDMATFPSGINGEGATTGIYGSNTDIHGFVRSPEGITTSFDVPNGPAPEISCMGFTNPTSINQEGVITGSCSTGSPGLPSVIGWVRYP
jgi:hypothetical protein